jgi:hypothetical protein
MALPGGIEEKHKPLLGQPVAWLGFKLGISWIQSITTSANLISFSYMFHHQLNHFMFIEQCAFRTSFSQWKPRAY